MDRDYENSFTTDLRRLMENKHIIYGGLGAIGGYGVAKASNQGTLGTMLMIGAGHLGGHYLSK